MEVFLRIDINIIAAIILGLVFLFAFKRMDRTNELNRIFLVTLVIVMFQLLIEALTCIFNKRPETWLIPVSNGLHVILFLGAPVLTATWFIFIRKIIIPQQKDSLAFLLIVVSPVIINAVLSILSVFTGIIFFIDRTNTYMRGPYFFISFAATYFYLLLGIITVIKHRRKILRQEYYLMMTFGFFPVIGGILQWVFYGSLLMWSSSAFALIIVYIYLQERMIHVDELTGAWTRKSVEYYMLKRIDVHSSEPFGAIYIDIDRLKHINDTYGHQEGDYAIKEIISCVKGVLGHDDIIARLGGDEFIIILNHDDHEKIKNVIKDIQFALSVLNETLTKEYQLSCSYGFGVYSNYFTSFEQFLSYIDHQMYKNKHSIADK